MFSELPENSFLCVLPGESLPLGEDGKFLVKFFKDNYDVDIEYLEQVKTVPGKGPKGSRVDQIFNVYENSIDNFEKIKDTIGVEYAKDYVRKGEHRFYNERTFLSRFKIFQDELLKEEDLADEHVYQSLTGQ